ncbi:hypothetical protein BLJAPNOD_02932 [Ensifer sp. M14]|uniref:hypothetical protein n=1 Tax=Ensifer sp. M14 TaxID=2203782 RepID=UPI000E1CA063|nr:hypothetical protein [Ensifer sp. M14]RDL51791.1 hypothetical protein BLJAPNOD_02932 [Ensifer sp. M14]
MTKENDLNAAICLLPELILHRIDELFGCDKRDAFITLAVEKELLRAESEAFDLRDPIESLTGIKMPLPAH